MHVLILASTPGAAEKMQGLSDETADRYAVVAACSDVISSLEQDRPELILVERAALARVDLLSLSKLVEPGCWPPLVIMDTPAAGNESGLLVARRLAQPPPQHYQVGELRIDARKRRASIGERWATLPPIQYRLLVALAQREGEVIGCQELLRVVWGFEAEEAEARELVKVHIRQIRRRLGLDPEEHPYIQSIRGFGYMLAKPDES
jgi:DNA-binding winged helix-turn-helix (wHTH) protein